jgi:hypothetical protein
MTGEGLTAVTLGDGSGNLIGGTGMVDRVSLQVAAAVEAISKARTNRLVIWGLSKQQ